MLPTSARDFESLISKPRLLSYRNYFHTTSLEEAVGLYMWNCELSAAFSTLLSYYELALRNNVHRALSSFYSRGAATSHNWYDAIWSQLKRETQDQIDKIRYQRRPGGVQVPRVPAPGPDEIVSRLSFGFWPSVLSTLDRRYVTQLLPSVFPNHPLNANPLNWSTKATCLQALNPIYELNSFRNRIAHHEPLWKFAAITDTSANPPVVLMPASLSEADSVMRFRRLLGIYDNGVRVLNPGLLADLQDSTWRRKLDLLLSARGIQRYRALRHKPRGGVLAPKQFRERFPLILKSNQPVRIGAAKGKGVFFPD